MAIITELVESPYLWQGIGVALVVVFLSIFYDDFADGYPYKKIPIIGWNHWSLTNKKAKDRFVTSARELITEGFSQGRTMFQLMFSFRPVIILDPRYLDEIKNHPLLSFDQATKTSFFGGKYPGFEIFDVDKDHLNLNVINKKLTQSLGQLTAPLSRETADVVKDTYSESKEWSSHVFAREVPYMVARISSLVFLGPEICRDEEWLNVSVNYTIDVFRAVRELRQWPSVLRPFIHWFLPMARNARNHVRVADKIIQRELEKREKIRQGTLAVKDEKRRPDFLDWSFEITAGRPFNATRSQIGLSLAAIHTTSNLLTNIMYDLAAYPEYFEPLREEIKRVLEEDGVIKKTSLTKMKLMDSVLKESQRMNPVSMTALHRYSMQDIALSDGTIIPKGANVMISASAMRDESIYPDANVYNGFRFFNKRQEPGNEHRFQFVTTSPEHLAFGHGMHACPGRFFANNEIKILLVHLLMKYDWKLAEHDQRPKNFENGTEIICDPTVKLLFRARQPEVDLARLGEDPI